MNWIYTHITHPLLNRFSFNYQESMSCSYVAYYKINKTKTPIQVGQKVFEEHVKAPLTWRPWWNWVNDTHTGAHARALKFMYGTKASLNKRNNLFKKAYKDHKWPITDQQCHLLDTSEYNWQTCWFAWESDVRIPLQNQWKSFFLFFF